MHPIKVKLCSYFHLCIEVKYIWNDGLQLKLDTLNVAGDVDIKQKIYYLSLPYNLMNSFTIADN